MRPRLALVIPTYNEAANLPRLLRRLHRALVEAGACIEVIVVDDGSPDGTAAVAERMAPTLRPAIELRLLQRGAKRGLSSAVIEGWAAADAQIPFLGVMDADLSHPPELVPVLLEALQQGATQVAIASRNVPGGGVLGWGMGRRATSWGATLLARPLTMVRDPMSGYFLFDRTLLQGRFLQPVGYKVLLELLVRARPARVVEVPFLFADRTAGASKLGARLYLTYLRHLCGLYGARMRLLGQAGRFVLVGALGVVVNLALLWGLVLLGVAPLPAAVGAFALAVSCNFALHRTWTFEPTGSGRRYLHGFLRQYGRYVGGSVLALGLNLLVLALLLQGGLALLPSQIAAIGSATGVNYALARGWGFLSG